MSVSKIPMHVSHWDTRGKQSRKNTEDWHIVLLKGNHCFQSDAFCYFVGWKEIRWFRKKLGFDSPKHQVHFPKADVHMSLRRGLTSVGVEKNSKAQVRFEKGLSYTDLLSKAYANSVRKLPSQLHEAIIKSRRTTPSDFFLLLVHQCFQKSRKKCMT